MPISHVGNWTRHKNFSVERWRGEKEKGETVEERRDKRTRWKDGRARWRRGGKREVGITEHARRRRLWYERREGDKGEHECRKSRRKLSNKDVSYFYILGEDRGIFRARFMVLLLCLLLRQMLPSRSVRSRRRVPAKGARLREDVYFVGRANMICRLLFAQRIVQLDGLKRRIFHDTKKYYSHMFNFRFACCAQWINWQFLSRIVTKNKLAQSIQYYKKICKTVYKI